MDLLPFIAIIGAIFIGGKISDKLPEKLVFGLAGVLSLSLAAYSGFSGHVFVTGMFLVIALANGALLVHTLKIGPAKT